LVPAGNGFRFTSASARAPRRDATLALALLTTGLVAAESPPQKQTSLPGWFIDATLATAIRAGDEVVASGQTAIERGVKLAEMAVGRRQPPSHVDVNLALRDVDLAQLIRGLQVE